MFCLGISQRNDPECVALRIWCGRRKQGCQRCPLLDAPRFEALGIRMAPCLKGVIVGVYSWYSRVGCNSFSCAIFMAGKMPNNNVTVLNGEIRCQRAMQINYQSGFALRARIDELNRIAYRLACGFELHLRCAPLLDGEKIH